MHKILAGLIFSCLGDALLNHNYFVYGMCAFSLTQICYIMAFGFQPLKLWIGILLYTAGAAGKIRNMFCEFISKIWIESLKHTIQLGHI